MERRAFNRLALGVGFSSLLPGQLMAQSASGDATAAAPGTATPAPKPTIRNTPRVYNQINSPRGYAADRRRFSIYWAWSYPWEANRDLSQLDNRLSTMTEVRRVAWPEYESPQWSERSFLQGIAGTLELFHLSLVRFQSIVGDTTGFPVSVYQRVDQAGQRLPIDERILADTDTLMVFGIDHMASEQEADVAEIEALRNFLTREGTCLLIGPHHDVGASDDLKEREVEYLHHGDPLVPRQQRFGRYTRSLMKGLGVPVENRWGLHPASIPGTHQIAPLTANRDLDKRGWLTGVTNFNFHPHLPHYAVTADDEKAIQVLARQPIDLSRPHPFTAAGNREFNTFLWMPPSGTRGGDILIADLTMFTTLFGGAESLDRFWANLATRA